jgi:hypothetical protein
MKVFFNNDLKMQEKRGLLYFNTLFLCRIRKKHPGSETLQLLQTNVFGNARE